MLHVMDLTGNDSHLIHSCRNIIEKVPVWVYRSHLQREINTPGVISRYYKIILLSQLEKSQHMSVWEPR